jgi:hypothetical protein
VQSEPDRQLLKYTYVAGDKTCKAAPLTLWHSPRATKAETTLKEAMTMCSANKCSRPFVATLHRDLATVLAVLGGPSRQTDAVSAFVTALKLDPSVTPVLRKIAILDAPVLAAFMKAKLDVASHP